MILSDPATIKYFIPNLMIAMISTTCLDLHKALGEVRFVADQLWGLISKQEFAEVMKKLKAFKMKFTDY